MIVDFYTHIYPERYFQELGKVMERLGGKARPVRSVAKLIELEPRFRDMDALGDYRQIVSLPTPPFDDLPDEAARIELARIANDDLAELTGKHPDRFPGFAAAVSLRDTDAAIAEADRAINQLGACGVQIFTNVAGKPLDDPQFEPFFAAMAAHNRPIWLHPYRSAAMTDFAAEKKSRYEMWICFGWPYETSVTMARLVFTGLFDRHPDIKILTHHLGGMIPFFEGRIGPGMEVLGVRTPDEDYSSVLPALKRPHMDYFHMFYGDTALFSGGHGYECGLKFFGADKVVFASDAPYALTAETIAAVEALDITKAELEKIMIGNAEKLVGRSLS